MDREARGSKSPADISRRRASMEGGMAGHGMSASYQPAEKSKTKQNFLKTSKTGPPCARACALGISGSFCAFMGLLGGRQSIETGRERGCEEMIKHFFTTPFIILFSFIMLFCKSPRNPLLSKDRSRGGCRRCFSMPWRGRPCLRRGHRPCRFQRGQREGRGIW